MITTVFLFNSKNKINGTKRSTLFPLKATYRAKINGNSKPKGKLSNNTFIKEVGNCNDLRPK